MIAEVMLTALLASCAPSISSDTMRAVVMVESNANPFAIGDNTARRSYALSDYQTAVVTASALIAQGHNIDLGLGQVNSVHLDATATVADMFNPCRNLRVASSILAADYARAQQVFPDAHYALRAALGAYNTGSIYGGTGYVARVIAAASVPSIAILTGDPFAQRSQPASKALKVTVAPTPVAGPWRGTWGRP